MELLLSAGDAAPFPQKPVVALPQAADLWKKPSKMVENDL